MNYGMRKLSTIEILPDEESALSVITLVIYWLEKVTFPFAFRRSVSVLPVQPMAQAP